MLLNNKYVIWAMVLIIAAPVKGISQETKAFTAEQKAEVQKKLYAALQQANPEYKGKADIKVDDSGAIFSVALTDGAAAIADISPLKGLPLKSVGLTRTKIKDLEPLRGMPLTVVYLQDNWALTDISALEGTVLTDVALYNCKSVKDISSLKSSQLKHINFEGSAITDLSPLKGQPIEEARICCPVLDLSPLAGMPLRHVDVGGGTGNDKNFKDLSPLKGMTRMNDLRFDQTSVSDISVIKDMKELKILAMFKTEVKDLSAIEGIELEALFFDPQNFPQEQIKMVREMKSLKRIDNSWRSWPKGQPPETFWKRYDAGEFQKSPGTKMSNMPAVP